MSRIYIGSLVIVAVACVDFVSLAVLMLFQMLSFKLLVLIVLFVFSSAVVFVLFLLLEC